MVWPRRLSSGSSGGSRSGHRSYGRAPGCWALNRGMQRGRRLGTGAGFIAVAQAWSRATADARGFAHERALSAPPSVSPRRTRGSFLLPWFNG
jgi:hypothetical protein